ncbi:MAG: YicC/YloC family endoribonuclease [Bacteroidaceae bacterium]
MIQSMTGYGKADAVFEEKKIHAEIKSLNSKNLDLSTRIAPVYREKEMEIRATIAKTLERGKVEFNIWVESSENQTAQSIHGAAINGYIAQIKTLSAEKGIAEPADWWTVLTRMPDITAKPNTEELSEKEWAVAAKTIDKAIDNLVNFRKQEGAALAQKFEGNIERITNLLFSIEPFEKQRVEKIRRRITDSLEAMHEVEYDKNRLEQELIYYIEKLDINEEKQRLTNHLKYFCETMKEGHGQGKKLGFIAQEMGREINTTGSKSNLAEMQNIVVKMKDELEQIKEQVLNVM